MKNYGIFSAYFQSFLNTS